MNTCFNQITNNQYTGKNQELLLGHMSENGLRSLAWAGFKQWQQAGRKVMKGAKGCAINMVCTKKVQSKSGDVVEKKVCKKLYVFNLDQTELVSE